MIISVLHFKTCYHIWVQAELEVMSDHISPANTQQLSGLTPIVLSIKHKDIGLYSQNPLNDLTLSRLTCTTNVLLGLY